MLIARQSTARAVIVGPVLDADGVAVTGGVVGDFKVAKNGGVPGALNGSATLTHRHTGFYSLALTASDLDTVGQAEVTIDDTVNACPVKEITVVEEAVYDISFAASATGSVPVASIAAGAITAAAIATGAIDADAVAADAVTEIQLGLATSAALTTVDTVVDAIKAVTDLLPDAGALTQIGVDAGTAATEATGANVAATAAQTAAEAVQDVLADMTEDDLGTPRFTTNALEQSQIAAAAALTAYDPPTRTEATSDIDSVLARLPAALVGGRIDATVDATGMESGAIDAILDDTIGDGTLTMRQALRVLVAGMAGKLSGAATSTVTIRNTADSSNVIVATVDADGNRSAVTVNP
jgi:hypothetical protein